MKEQLQDGLERLHRWRDASARRRAVYRVAVGVVGTVVTVGGILAIPFPGPGWLIVFAGLGILASEFTWARAVLRFVKRYYDLWLAWMQRQSHWVQLLVLFALAVVVVAVLWFIGVFSLVGGWFGVHWAWLRGPMFG